MLVLKDGRFTYDSKIGKIRAMLLNHGDFIGLFIVMHVLSCLKWGTDFYSLV